MAWPGVSAQPRCSSVAASLKGWQRKAALAVLQETNASTMSHPHNLQ